MSSKFVHLHTHSHYSLLDGMSKIDTMVEIAKKHGMSAMAITDHGNMYGAIEFYKACKGAGIKPIIGVEAYMTAGSRKDKTTETGQKRYYHLILLAKNLQGYKNLIKLVTLANMEGYYYKPRMDKEILREHSEGIIALSGCMGGELSQAVLTGDIEKADTLIKEYQDIFGKENYFIEIQSHPHVEKDREVREKLIELGKKHNVKIVATQDSHYPCSDDHEAHRTLLAINTQGDGKETGKFEFSEDDFSLIDEKKALEFFSDYPESVSNTMLVSDMCNLELDLGKWVFPDYKVPDGSDPDAKLAELAYLGIKEHGLVETPEMKERIEYELSIIRTKGYSKYFLVVSDLIKFAKTEGILTTTRGSAAGSFVSYLVGITTVNPIEYKLPFERFLNPYRPSPPDIDLDIADDRREEMLDYAKRKYGEDHVAQIGTFGTMMAKGSVRDVARALGYPYAVGDRISNLIPMGSQGFPMTIDHAMELVPELKTAYEKEPDTKKIIDLAKKIEGCARHISVHAAGVVISPLPTYEYTPTQLDPRGGKIITQYDMYSIEEAGLLKFDFLGIRNLSILADSIKLVKKFYDIDIDIENVPLEDKKTFELLASGETEGLFQLNGSGMTRYLKELKPTSIHDINAMVALYRPGPMESIPEYIRRKHNPSLIKYLDPRMKKFLSESYGIIVYQDDLLFCALEMAGYNWEEADKFRKAVGKKIPAEMAAQKEKFTKGIVANGQTQKFADELWKLFEPFQAYGFNKAHAASYGKVAYQTAYMKANYPVEYMCAILSAESGDVEKIGIIITECKKMNISVLPPDINESFGLFTVLRNNNKSENIRFGLYTIKNMGTDISDAIIEERKASGPFKSITDFLDRIKHKNLNKKSLEALIKSGAIDAFGERGVLLGNVEEMLAYNKESARGNANQTSLFGELTESAKPVFKLKETNEATPAEKLAWEKELLGLYISGHPLDRVREKIEKSGMNIKKIKESAGAGMAITIACIIEDVRVVNTRNMEQMAFIKIADLSDQIEAVVFPKLFAGALKPLFAIGQCIALSGRVTLRNNEKSIVIENAKAV